jgi:translation initiation factor IF-2
MSKVRVYELAQDLGLEHTVVEERCRELGISVDSHLAQLSPEETEIIRNALQDKPPGEVSQKRVRTTVIRRRRRVDKVAEEAAPEAVEAAEVAAPAAPAEVVAEAEAPEQAASEAPAPAEVQVEAAEVAPEAPGDVVEAPAPDATTVVAAKVDGGAVGKGGGYANAEAVNAPGKQEQTERESLVKVVGRIDPSLAQNLERPVRPPPRRGPPGPGGPPTRRPGPPGSTPDPMNIPLADRSEKTGGAGRDSARRKRGGRVAYDRTKDRGFDQHMRARGRRGKQRKRVGATTELTTPKASKRVVKLEDTITVGLLAQQLSVKATELIKYLMQMGEMATVNHTLDLDTVTLIAQEYEFTVENVAFDMTDYIPKTEVEEPAVVPRDPVVTVMGHVDHGKTSLLDYIREARVAAGEAGGITQHIGAYKVPVTVNGEEKPLVFLDTPGHAAFSAMRARGAQVTDVVILVVAADDGVMPQTIEAINHARAAEVPIVVAVNKCDREDADPKRVRTELTEHGLVDEEWGGDTQMLDVSAITGDGVEALLEAVMLQAELLELTASVDKHAQGVIVEAELSRGRGPVATVLIHEGTLRKGDIVVAGRVMGRVRALVDDKGNTVTEVGPSTPVEVLGMNGVPQPSDKIYVVKDERDARQIVSHLEDKDRSKRLAEERKNVSLDDLFERIEAGDVKTLALIIKSDVQGSLEALRSAFEKLEHPELEVKIIHAGVGPVNESDVTLAAASDAIIIGFNVRPEKNAKALSEQEGVEVKLYTVIYDAVDEVKAAMEGMLDAVVKEQSLGKAEVREVFKLSKWGIVAGCAVLQGKVIRHAHARLVRDGIVLYTGKVDTLRRFKESVTEVERGHECGIKLVNYSDVKVSDEIEVYELVETAQTLNI